MKTAKVTELFAWIAINDVGDEGIVGGMATVEGREMLVPLIAADRRNIETHRETAMQLAQDVPAVRVQLRRFHNVSTIEEV